MINSGARDRARLTERSELQGRRSSQAAGPSSSIASQRLQTVPEAPEEGLRVLVAGR